MDGTLGEAWASLKRFKRKEAGQREPPADRGNPTVNLRGECRSNATHQSPTEPEAQLARKGAGKEARLCYSANALMENRHARLVDFQVEPADGYAERRAALAMLDERLPGRRRVTLGGDKATTPATWWPDPQAGRVGLRLDENGRWSASHRQPVQLHAYLVAAAYNLVRIARLAPAGT